MPILLIAIICNNKYSKYDKLSFKWLGLGEIDEDFLTVSEGLENVRGLEGFHPYGDGLLGEGVLQRGIEGGAEEMGQAGVLDEVDGMMDVIYVYLAAG